MVDLRSCSHQVFLKERDAGGTDASEPTMHPCKRVAPFISVRRLRIGAVDQINRLHECFGLEHSYGGEREMAH